MGSSCRQSYAADTFSLGLCFLHLLTGHEPYEELLKDVKCPVYLQELLAPHWETNDPNSPYYIISETMSSLDGDDGKVLYDTIYRYIVLLGIPSELLSNSLSPWIGNPVWNCILEALDYLPSSSSMNRRIKKIKEECSHQYIKDRQLWSFAIGTNPIIVNAKSKLMRIDGATRLFEQMLHFDPSRRCTMHGALHSPMFNIFKDNSYNHSSQIRTDYTNSNEKNYRGIGRGSGNDICSFTTSFMHYYRDNDNDGLPML
jgi:serine/threonine protein kinase